MAVKRNFSAKDSKARSCLKCGRPLDLEDLKDDTVCTCKCGQKMFVDRYGDRVTLTVCEKPDLRRRIPDNIEAMQMIDHARLHKVIMAHNNGADLVEKIDALENENKDLKAQLEEAKKNAAEWEKAADGLARMIEELKSQAKE